jgi:hypothetical protein
VTGPRPPALALALALALGAAACDETLVGPMAAPPAPAAGPPAAMDPAACSYPEAPPLAETRFAVGSVIPDLLFYREDASELRLQQIHCDGKHRLLLWLVGGDECGPCVSQARSQEIPAWQALGPQGLFVLEGFNGRKMLVSDAPFARWREYTGWPPDGEHVALVTEPTSLPYYAVGHVTQAIPWNLLVDLATMKVIAVDARLSIPSLTMRLQQLAPRP